MSPHSFPQCTIEMIVLIVWSDCSGWMCCRGADGTRPRHRRGWRPTKARWDSAQWTIWGGLFFILHVIIPCDKLRSKVPTGRSLTKFPLNIIYQLFNLSYLYSASRLLNSIPICNFHWSKWKSMNIRFLTDIDFKHFTIWNRLYYLQSYRREKCYAYLRPLLYNYAEENSIHVIENVGLKNKDLLFIYFVQLLF